MRRLALVLFVLGLVSFGGALAVGLIGVDIDVAGQTYDCGSPIGRLGGDDREQKWAADAFLINSGGANIDPAALPHQACKQKTDDRLTWVYVLAGLGAVLVVVSVVLFFVGRRRRTPAPAPATPPPAEAA